MTGYSPENPIPESERKERELISVVSDFEDERGEHPTIEIDKNPPALLLFDIDGTLADAKSIHGQAIVSLYGDKFKIDGLTDEKFRQKFMQDWFSNFGKGDREEHELLLAKYGINFSSEEEKQRAVDGLVLEYGKKFEEVLASIPNDEKDKMLLPGVKRFLEAAKSNHIPSAIVTGNVRRTAEAIVKHLGLAKYFITGGYDDDPGVTSEGMRRASILKSTIEKCRAKGIDLPPEQVAVFGDTPKDFHATLDSESKPKVFLFATGDVRFWDLTSVKDANTEKRPYLILPKLSGIKIKEFFESLRKR